MSSARYLIQSTPSGNSGGVWLAPAMMSIVIGCNPESPVGFRADPQTRGAARRPCRRMNAPKHNGTAPPTTMAIRRRRIHAECAVITAFIGTASSVVGAAHLPVTMWLRSEWAHPAVSEPMHQVTADMQNAACCANDVWKLPSTLNVVLTPAAWQKSAVGEAFAAEHYGQVRPEFSAYGTVPTALIRPIPLGEITPDPPQIPAPTLKPIAPPVAPPPRRVEQQLSPPRQQEGPPPQQEGPPPQQETPPPQPPPVGHVQLAP